MIFRRPWFLIICGTIASTGCNGALSSKTVQESPLVQAPADPPPMTPAEVARQYRAAYEKGLRLVGEGQYGLALGAFDKAAALRPASTEALFNLGACYEEIGDPPRAINIYRRVLEMTPDDPDCFANLGTSFIKMYHREKSPVWRKMAREAWQRSLDLDPGQQDVREYLSRSESVD